jgi:signal peptidase I
VVTGDWPGPGSDDSAVVPNDAYFVLGDNRDNSKDSRVFSWVSSDEIEGKAFVRFWPVGRANLLDVGPTLVRPPT